jgi:cell division septal protein FtsQ
VKKKEKKSKKPNTKRRSSRDDSRDDDVLSEFSDGFSDFYVDEVGDRDEDRRARSGRDQRSSRDSKKREPKKRPPKKPKSPLQRKLTRIFSTVAIVAVVLTVGVVLSLTVLFKTQAYEVVGNTLYLESDIIETCGIKKGENIFLAPKKSAADRIEERFPYVDEARVNFSIPDTIRIEITQAVEGYLFKASDTEYLIISTRGRILNRTSDISGYDLPIFIGPKLSSGEVGDYITYEDETILDIIDNITRVFADNGYTGITEINAANTAGITFTYQSRIKVKLGIPEDLSYKIRTAMTIIKENIDINPESKIQGVLDVSRCNVTKRSYFSEQEIGPTQPPTEAPTDAEGTSDNSDDADGTSDGDTWYSEDEYTWTEENWSDEWYE